MEWLAWEILNLREKSKLISFHRPYVAFHQHISWIYAMQKHVIFVTSLQVAIKFGTTAISLKATGLPP
jgi:hypothetical protein